VITGVRKEESMSYGKAIEIRKEGSMSYWSYCRAMVLYFVVSGVFYWLGVFMGYSHGQHDALEEFRYNEEQ